MIKKRIFFHPQRFFLDNVPKQSDGTCYVLNAEYGELWAAYGEQEQENERLQTELQTERMKLQTYKAGLRRAGVDKSSSDEPLPSRSVQRRVAAMRGEPAPEFGTPPHTTEEDFQHFMAYSNLQMDEHALRWAFYAGKGEPPPGKSSEQHASDCAVNNAPALPVGPCNCGAKKSSERCICPGDYILKECPAQHPAEGAIVQPWPWPMCNGCGNEPNACTCDSERT